MNTDQQDTSEKKLTRGQSIAVGFGIAFMLFFLLGAMGFIVWKTKNYHEPTKLPRRASYELRKTT